ncbi:hypothetical protein HPB49_003984 [Dermacentor silvarum]|uniref:Uncharacterized protein n=1 Tax=Dermacentor silvarum TaxID=543639 RepID=A0ACB8CPN7_DERSI|nr:hypothetical protein HPB49_003984 [Dermacentor silvarum]
MELQWRPRKVEIKLFLGDAGDASERNENRNEAAHSGGSANQPRPGDTPSDVNRSQRPPHHEGLPPGSQDSPTPASEAESSGGGTTETAPDRITTEPGSDASHVPRDIPDR